jgi:hypothetical protein
MKKMKIKNLSALLLLLSPILTQTQAQAQEQGHGGGECDRRIKEIAKNLRDDWIKKDGTRLLQFKTGDTAEIFDAKALAVLNPLLDKTNGAVKINCTDDKIFVDEVEKDCKWEPVDPKHPKGQKQILCNYNRYVGDKNHPVSEITQFHDGVHELLGVAGLEVNNLSDSDYFYTDQLSENAKWVPHFELVVNNLGDEANWCKLQIDGDGQEYRNDEYDLRLLKRKHYRLSSDADWLITVDINNATEPEDPEGKFRYAYLIPIVAQQRGERIKLGRVDNVDGTESLDPKRKPYIDAMAAALKDQAMVKYGEIKAQMDAQTFEDIPLRATIDFAIELLPDCK